MAMSCQKTAADLFGAPSAGGKLPVIQWNRSSPKSSLRRDETDFHPVFYVLYVLYVLWFWLNQPPQLRTWSVFWAKLRE
jgi:hypothetical protein